MTERRPDDTLRDDALRDKARAYLEAQGRAEAAAIVARAELQSLPDPQIWTVDGRAVRAWRVALWLTAADRVAAHDHPALRDELSEALAIAIESPSSALRELLVLQRPAVDDALPSPAVGRAPYREAPASRAGMPRDGRVVAATAAAYLQARGAPALAALLRGGAVWLEPAPGGRASRVVVSLAPDELARVHGEPRDASLLREALEAAALGPAHRATDVSFALSSSSVPSRGGQGSDDAPSKPLATAARALGATLVPLGPPAASGDGETHYVVVRAGRAVLLAVSEKARAWDERPDRITTFVVPAGELADDDGALRALTRLTQR